MRALFWGCFLVKSLCSIKSLHELVLIETVSIILHGKFHTDRNGKTTTVERIETVLIRSNGDVLTAAEMPFKPGTPVDQRVWRLSDKTLVDQPPVPYQTIAQGRDVHKSAR